MTDPQTETQTDCRAAHVARVVRALRDADAYDISFSLIGMAADALDAQAAEIATLRETVANVSDAIAEYCALNGDEGMPRDLAEAVRFIGRAGLTPPPSAGETK